MTTTIKEFIHKIPKMIISNGVDSIDFHFTDGTQYIMDGADWYGDEIIIVDMEGDLTKLIGNPILKAEVVSEEIEDGLSYTFYHLANVKEYVTIRWKNDSQYYSNEVRIIKI